MIDLPDVNSVEWKNLKKCDIGCGSGPNRPAKGFDAYCDIHDPNVVMAKPYWQCPMEEMTPFKDKEFDFARCHHVIEHTQDPDKACRELIRIAKAGIISFPPPQAEMMYGRKDHNWYVFIDRGRLLFVQKFHASLGIPRSVTRSELNVDFHWEGSFDWQVVRVDK